VKALRIASRGSKLARWQATHIQRRLARECGVDSEIVIIRTAGDHLPAAPLAEIGGQGVFVKEIEQSLLDAKVDLAVHSMKDLPTELPAGLCFPAICEREDVRDALISSAGWKLSALPRGARVGTSSLRRQAQLRRARSDLHFVELRGNVDTRLAKLEGGECEAIVLAKAGLDRLGWTARISEVLSPEVSLPAAGQGALAIESRAGDGELRALLARLDHAATRAAVLAERALLRELQGGCQIPLGAWARLEKGELWLEACVASVDGSGYVRRRVAGDLAEPEKLGRRAAAELLAAGAAGILEEELRGRGVGGKLGGSVVER
jgi:hydroxymethylbilane synthase